MRGTELLKKMELIDPAYVEAADKKPNRRTHAFLIWGTAAACIALMLAVGTTFFPQEEISRDPDLPMLTISDDTSARGFEGYMAYDISELVNANPWDENCAFSTLPVFRNSMAETDTAMMKTFLLDIADRFGLDTDDLTITDDLSEDIQQKITEKYHSIGETVPQAYSEPAFLSIKADGIEIRVDRSMTARISFEPPIRLPDEYNFTYYAPYEDTAAVAEYLKTEYSNLIGMDDPRISISGGDYNIYNQQGYQIEFFDDDEDDLTQILNYNFNSVLFYSDDNGELFLARVHQYNLSEKLGDYPIITAKQAKSMLLDGKYITSVPYDLPDVKNIKKVELIYRTAGYDEYFMPYYRFYAELPELERENGMKTYGAYYVPAVEEIYIADLSVWDGNLLG